MGGNGAKRGGGGTSKAAGGGGAAPTAVKEAPKSKLPATLLSGKPNLNTTLEGTKLNEKYDKIQKEMDYLSGGGTTSYFSPMMRADRVKYDKLADRLDKVREQWNKAEGY